MNLYDAFIQVFGDVTLLEIVLCGGAILFMLAMYKKFSDHIVKKHDEEQEREAKLEESYDCVHNKYPEYRQQSLKIQQELTARMDNLDGKLDVLVQRLVKMEDDDNRRERNKLRDLLLQHFRHYGSKEKNPSQTWTRVESETFWELYKEYENSGGNGYMHTDVLPVMRRLEVVDVIDR